MKISIQVLYHNSYTAHSIQNIQACKHNNLIYFSTSYLIESNGQLLRPLNLQILSKSLHLPLISCGHYICIMWALYMCVYILNILVLKYFNFNNFKNICIIILLNKITSDPNFLNILVN